MTKSGVRLFYDTNFPTKDYNPQIPLLVFNYGLVCNPQHYKEQYPFFENQGYQILIYNYRGHFNSSGNEDISSCTFANMAMDLHELLEEVGATDNIFLIGHSMGVNICLEYCYQYLDDQRIRGNLLLSGSILPPQEVMFDTGIIEIITPLIEHLAKTYPDIAENVWKKNYLNPLNYTMLYKGGFNTKQVSLDFVQFYAKKISELPHQLFLQLMREMKDHQLFNNLPQINTPSLIIGGDKDKVIPLHLQYILHQQLPNSELYLIKNGSHVPQSDFPELINERMNLFIQKKMLEP
jgi:pimeloyl-ACP methyl ester carboxylesterase